MKEHFCCEQARVFPLGGFHHMPWCCAAVVCIYYCRVVHEMKEENVLCNQNCCQKHFSTDCMVLNFFFMGNKVWCHFLKSVFNVTMRLAPTFYCWWQCDWRICNFIHLQIHKNYSNSYTHTPWLYGTKIYRRLKMASLMGEKMVVTIINMIIKSTLWITSYTAVCKNKLVNIFKILLSMDSINFYMTFLILCSENHETVSTLF
jgi:hypothetical protein